MKIKFYNQTGKVVSMKVADANDYWDACMEGWALIGMGLVTQAIDFDVVMED